MYHVIIADKNDKILYGEIFNYIGEIDFTETGLKGFYHHAKQCTR